MSNYEEIEALIVQRNSLLARVKELEVKNASLKSQLDSMTVKASQYRNALYGHVEFPSQGASWERVAEMDTKMKDLEESLKLKEAAYGVLVDVNTDLSHQLHQRDTALVAAREALIEAHNYVSGKTKWIGLATLSQAIKQIDHALSQIQEVKP